jgi:hypothetical protein
VLDAIEPVAVLVQPGERPDRPRREQEAGRDEPLALAVDHELGVGLGSRVESITTS